MRFLVTVLSFTLTHIIFMGFHQSIEAKQYDNFSYPLVTFYKHSNELRLSQRAVSRYTIRRVTGKIRTRRVKRS